MVVFINLGLRPLVKFLKRKTKAGLPVMRQFRILLTCTPSSEGEARSLILRTLTVGGLKLSEISADPVDGGIEISALFTGEGVTDSMLDLAMQRLAAEPGIGRLRWESLDEV